LLTFDILRIHLITSSAELAPRTNELLVAASTNLMHERPGLSWLGSRTTAIEGSTTTALLAFCLRELSSEGQSHSSHEEEDTCMLYEKEDTCLFAGAFL
jgi:hypothetical protein